MSISELMKNMEVNLRCCIRFVRVRHVSLIVLILWTCSHTGHSIFPHGHEAGDTEITSKRSLLVTLDPVFLLYGKNMSSVVIYRDAFFCFDNDVERDFYMLDKDSAVSFPAITVWASEIRTANIGGTGSVTYRLSTNKTELDQISMAVKKFTDFSTTFYPRYALVVTWDAVGTVHYDEITRNRTNTFQTLLVSDGLQSLIWMEYKLIQWIYDGSSTFYDYGGTIDTVDFTRAQVGFYNGDQKTKYILPSSFTSAIRYISTDSNVNISGLYMFRIDVVPTNLTAYIPTTTASTFSQTSTNGNNSTGTVPFLSTLGTTAIWKSDIITAVNHDDAGISGPVVGMSVACASLVLVTVAVLILVCRLKNKRRNARVKKGRVSPETCATNSKGNEIPRPVSSPVLRVTLPKSHSARSVISTTGVHVHRY